MNSAKRFARILFSAAVIGCVPAAMCRASDEPELASAIRQKNLPRVQSLLSQGANVNERDEGDEQTPLMRAAQTGDTAIMQMLLAHGASANAQDDFGHTALMFAAEKGNTAIVGLLLHKGANPGLRDREGETALTFAQLRRHETVIKRLRPLIARQSSSQQTAFLARR